MFPKFTPKQLKVFLTVLDTKSFRDAAEQLFMTPAAASQAVSELEKILGFKLFDRTTRAVSVSAGGAEFAGSAQAVLRQMELAHAAAVAVQNKAVGVIRVAAPQTLASLALPQAIAEYQKTHPSIVVQICDVAVEKLVDVVADGTTDISIGPDRAISTEVARQTVFDSPWVMWCSPTHALAEKKSVTWRQIQDYEVIAAGRDHEHSVDQMHATRPADKRVTPIIVVDNVTTALGMAAANLGVMLAPAYVSAMALRLGLVGRRILKTEVIREISLYTPTTRKISRATEGFIPYACDWLATWNRRTQLDPDRA